MPKIDIASVPVVSTSAYPEPFRSASAGKPRRKLGDAAGLSQFGVNLKTLEPGATTALRHWHENEDEFVWIVSGHATLIDDNGETPMGPGDAAGFRAGDPNGHQIANRSDAPVVLLEVGTRSPVETGHYPDDDLAYERTETGSVFTHKDGTPYE